MAINRELSGVNTSSPNTHSPFASTNASNFVSTITIPLFSANSVNSLKRFSKLLIISGNISLTFCVFKGISFTPFVVGVNSGVSNLLGNKTLEQVMQNEFDKLGPVIFDESDKVFATQIRSTLTEADILDSFQRIGIEAPLICLYAILLLL